MPPGWRLDRALAAALPTLSRERLKALISSGAGDRARGPRSAIRRRRRWPAPTRSSSRSPRRPITRRRTSRSTSSSRTIICSSSTSRRGWSSIRRRAISTGRWSTPCSTIAPGGCRASAGWRGRGSSTGSTRTRRGCWSSPRPTSPMRGWRRSSPGTASTAAIWRSSPGCPNPPAGTIDAPLARSSANRKKMAIVEGGRGKRAVTHYRIVRAAARRGAGRMPARNRPDPPGAGPHGLDRPSPARRSGLWPDPSGASGVIEKTGF